MKAHLQVYNDLKDPHAHRRADLRRGFRLVSAMDLSDIHAAFREVNEHDIPYDIGIIRTERIAPVWCEYERHYSSAPPPFIKSAIVYVVFTSVAADYYFREELTPRVIEALNSRFGNHFGYDDYRTNRKQLAVMAGLGKIAKQSLVFNDRFGLNCKIDAIFSTLEFDGYREYDGERYYEACASCAAPCISRCPMKCHMDYRLHDVSLCDHHITPHWNTPELMCRACIEACELSQRLLKDIPPDAHERRGKPQL